MLRFGVAVAVAALAVFSCVSGDAVDGNPSVYIFEDQFLEILKNLSASLAENDPATIPELKVNIQNDIVKLDLQTTDVVITGYSKFEATELKITIIPPAATFNVQFEKIDLVVPYYNVDALAVFIPFYGSGSVNLHASLINLGGTATVGIGAGGITGVKNLKLKFNLADANLQISGLLHNEPMSQIVSTATTECFAEFINKYGDRIGELVGGIIEGAINGIIAPPAPPAEGTKAVGPVTHTGTIDTEKSKIHYSFVL